MYLCSGCDLIIYHYAANYWPGMPITESRGCSRKREEAKGRSFSSFVPYFSAVSSSKYGLKKEVSSGDSMLVMSAFQTAGARIASAKLLSPGSASKKQ